MSDNKKLTVLIVTLLAALSTALAADAPSGHPAGSVSTTLANGAAIELNVPLFKSRLVSVAGPVGRIAVGSPDIADIVVISPYQLYVLGKDLGTTNVLLWDNGNRLIGALTVAVQHDLEDLKRKLAEVLPGEAIEVRSAQRSIVLSGRVSDADKADAAVRIARWYLAQIQTAVMAETFKQQNASKREDKTVGEVINLLTVGGVQQVMLEVKVAEMQRSEVRSLNLQFNSFRNGGNWNWGGVSGGATFPQLLDSNNKLVPPFFSTQTGVPNYTSLSPVLDNFFPTTMSIADKGLFASFLNKNFLFNLAFDAAKNKGLAKILAEPTLTTLTGQEAKFLAGGEFPIPVAELNGAIGITYKPFGVGLDFVPVVLANGHINLKLSISVSELVNTETLGIAVANANTTFIVPSLRERSASGTVELLDGQTIGLAGLLSDSMTQAVNKFPGLGDVPILGALFRSQNYQKADTELVILVTPHLAKPIARERIKLPTDSYVEPTDADFYIWGRMEGTAKPSDESQK